MDKDNLEVGKLIHMLKTLSADADVSEMLGLLPGSISAVEAIKQCEEQRPQNIVGVNNDRTGLTFTPVDRVMR